MHSYPIKRALLSVSDKTGIVEFANELVKLGVEIISTGGTSQVLQAANILHRQVDEVTQLPEMLDGRVKTLHPRVHGGILGRRDVHAKEAAQHGIEWIDLVVVNFYPFAAAVKKPNSTLSEVIEQIDIGGPTMVRAAAKNFTWVGVVVNPADYPAVIAELKEHQGLDKLCRQRLAAKAFALTAQYESMIQQYFAAQESDNEPCPPQITLQLEKKQTLRYGENPHQAACAYQLQTATNGILAATQLQGKPLSYNNLLDAEAAYTCVQEFSAPACVIVKHANPCGVAVAATIDDAYTRAYQADATSAFGGIIALNQLCTTEIAKQVASIFMEVIIAPAFSDEALQVLAVKPNLRVLIMPMQQAEQWEMRFITGAVLLQERDNQLLTAADLQIVTQQQPTASDIESMLFAWRVVKHIKSNAILLAKDNVTVGIGAGQVSRIDAVEIALLKAGRQSQGAVLASDAFFPFRDSIDRLANTGIKAIVQPGGSVRDEEVIAACNEYNIAMVFTGKRCFKH